MSGHDSGGRKWKRSRRSAHALVVGRIVASTVFFGLFAAGYLGTGVVADRLFAVFGATQLFPGLVRLAGGIAGGTLGGAAAVSVGVIVLSFFFGRIYCSALCPLGAAQDLVASAGRRNRKGYKYSKGVPYVRAAAFGFVVFAFVYGAGSLAGFFDPYTLASRWLEYVFRPILALVANGIEPFARNYGLYLANDPNDFNIWITTTAASAIAIILSLAFFRGRFFCNTLCPVGFGLGMINRVSLFRVRLDGKTCVGCGVCARSCKAECLDTENRRLDAERCVSCFACLEVCPNGSLRYGRDTRLSVAASAPDPTRRSFLRLAGVSGALIAAAAPIARLARMPAFWPRSLPPASPPGAVSLERFLSSCTACGLCVSKCPSKVLRPSAVQYGWRGFLMPYLDYETSYCQYECALCGDLCPSGALQRLPIAEKMLTQLGKAELVKEKCIVFTKGTACGACAEHCPTGSVRMAASTTGIPEPVFDETICIGCGACHHICPAEPEKAITVAGKAIQGEALPPTKYLFGDPEAQEKAKGADLPTDKENEAFPF